MVGVYKGNGHPSRTLFRLQLAAVLISKHHKDAKTVPWQQEYEWVDGRLQKTSGWQHRGLEFELPITKRKKNQRQVEGNVGTTIAEAVLKNKQSNIENNQRVETAVVFDKDIPTSKGKLAKEQEKEEVY